MSDAAERRKRKPLAVALRYQADALAAPAVVAKGKGDVARRILDLADRHGIPVRRDEDLLQLLALCDVGEEIPEDLFEAVAELLAYLYRLNSELSRQGG